MGNGSTNSIADWKRFLYSKGLCSNEHAFKQAMIRLDGLVASKVPSTKGMIWRNGNINPNATISDVETTLILLDKFGQATLDDLGDPSDPNRISGTPLNSMFISQEDSKLDEWTPENNQNQGRQGSSTPKKLIPSGNTNGNKTPEKHPQNTNIDSRMKAMMNLIENVKK